MRNAVHNFAASRSIALGRFATRERILSFLRTLHPVTTDKPLIRMGGDADGGYLVPDDFDGISACFSPGVDVIAGFELELAQRGIPCFLADASVEKAPVEDPLITFDRKFLGVWNDDTFITLDSWVEQYAPPSGDLLLQMDIEGAEWPVLLNVSDETLSRFRIVVLEIHYTQKLLQDELFVIIEAMLGRLTRLFHVVHNHPNNACGALEMGDLSVPRLLELTFLRKDRAEATGHARTFPHPLDAANVSKAPDMVLPDGWFRAD